MDTTTAYIKPHTARYIIISAVFFVFLAVGLCAFPWFSDDINYRLDLGTHATYLENYSLSTIFEQFVRRTTCDNSRLANLTMYLLLPLPTWITGILTSAMSLIAVLACCLIIRRPINTLQLLFVSSGFILFLPWTDQLYAFDFQLNYIWGCAFCFTIALVTLSKRDISRVLLFVATLFAGAWQECEALPTLMGLVAVFVSFRRMRNPRIIIAITALLIGLAWLWFSPGGRYYRTMDWWPFDRRMDIIYAYCVPISAYIITAFVYSIRKGRMSVVHTFFATIALTSMLVMLCNPRGPRICTIGMLAAVSGFAALIPDNPRRGLKTLTYILTTLSVANIVTTDTVAVKQRIAYDHLVGIATSGNLTADTIVFTNIILREYAPLLAMQKPHYNLFAQEQHVGLFNRFYSKDFRWVWPAPSELKDFSPEKADTLGGGSGFMVYRGMIVGPTDDDFGGSSLLITEHGPERFMRVPLPQTKDSNGHPRWAWYHTNTSSIRGMLHPIPTTIQIPQQ